MSFGGGDLFESWRFLLALVCGIYATVVLVRSIWEWLVYLSGSDRATTVLRRYILVQFLRLRVRRFAGELAQLGFWAVVCVILLAWH